MSVNSQFTDTFKVYHPQGEQISRETKHGRDPRATLAGIPSSFICIDGYCLLLPSIYRYAIYRVGVQIEHRFTPNHHPLTNNPHFM